MYLQDFTKFNPMKQKLLDTVDKMLAEDIARLMALIPHEDENRVNDAGALVRGGAFEPATNATPFGVGKLEGVDKGRGDEDWIVGKDR